MKNRVLMKSIAFGLILTLVLGGITGLDVSHFMVYADGGEGEWETLGVQDFKANIHASRPSLYVYGDVPYVAFADSDNDNKATVMKYEGGSWLLLEVEVFQQARLLAYHCIFAILMMCHMLHIWMEEIVIKQQ